MGSGKNDADAQSDEKPRHEVEVSFFYMSKYELTYGEFKTFVNETSYQTDADKHAGSYSWKKDAQGQPRDIDEKRHPVIHVSWNDAQAYIQWLNGKTGKTYRLPTEAEWEYAARGGAKSNGYLYSGSNSIGTVAWYNEYSNHQTHPVGQKQANELGIYDLTGNVWEWCQDWYNGDYYTGRPDLDMNPQGATTGEIRVYRGGSWDNVPVTCRVARRGGSLRGNRGFSLGFRLVLPSR